jgi:hypothetical protein
MPRDPLPVQLETGAMPANNCLWLHENQCSLPTRPEPSQHHPEQLVSNPKPGLWMPPFQRSELLPEGEIFEEQVAAKTDGSRSQNKQEPQQAEHGASLTWKIRRNPIHLHLSDLAADRNFGEAQLMGDHGHSGSDLRTACKVRISVSSGPPGRLYRKPRI